MSDNEERQQRPLTEEEARGRESLQRLPHPAPDPAFHARLRDEFVQGTITGSLPGPLLAGGPRWSLRRRLSPCSSWRPLLLNRPQAWTVVGVTGSGAIMVDEQEIPPLDLGSEIRPESGSRREATCSSIFIFRVSFFNSRPAETSLCLRPGAYRPPSKARSGPAKSAV